MTILSLLKNIYCTGKKLYETQYLVFNPNNITIINESLARVKKSMPKKRHFFEKILVFVPEIANRPKKV